MTQRFADEETPDDVSADLRAIAGARVLVTGGTGFVGRWLLERIRRANDIAGLGIEVVCVSRDPARVMATAPELAASAAFRFVAGDVRTALDVPGEFSHIVHAATQASADLNENDPRTMFDTIVAGTRSVLDFARLHAGVRVLNLSSGAVYGAQPWEIDHVDEAYRGGPDPLDPRAAYGEGKRAAEMLCAIYAKQFGVDVVTARIFAVLGPMLPLDTHFAAGNFILDAIAGRPIVVRGAGTAVRSYLYAGDMVDWLLAMLVRGQGGAAYNLGSENAVSIATLAERVATVLGGSGFSILGEPDNGWNPGRYVPATARARDWFGVNETVTLDEAIRRTARWNGWNG